LRKRVVVLLFLRVKAQIFEQQHVAVFKRVNFRPRRLARAVFRKRDFTPQQLREMRGDGAEAVFLHALALRPAQVRSENHARALLRSILNRRQRAAYARIVFHHALLQRHVEVNANENALPFQVEVFDR
jgi:hypothetical protein